MPRQNPQQVPHFHFLRIALHRFSVTQNHGNIGPEVHERSHRAAGALHRNALKQLPHLEKQHNRCALIKIHQRKGAYCRQGHQKMLIKHMAMANVFDRFDCNLQAAQQPGQQQQRHRRPVGPGRLHDTFQNHPGQKQNHSQDNPNQ